MEDLEMHLLCNDGTKKSDALITQTEGGPSDQADVQKQNQVQSNEDDGDKADGRKGSHEKIFGTSAPKMGMTLDNKPLVKDQSHANYSTEQISTPKQEVSGEANPMVNDKSVTRMSAKVVSSDCLEKIQDDTRELTMFEPISNQEKKTNFGFSTKTRHLKVTDVEIEMETQLSELGDKVDDNSVDESIVIPIEDSGSDKQPTRHGPFNYSALSPFAESTGTTTEMKDTVMFEFAVTGMTCVACTSSIERLMHSEFDSRKMISVSMVLLTNKMFCTFAADVFHDKIVTPEMICDEVEMIGFDCALLSIAEMKGDQQVAKTKEAFGDSRSDSIDSDVMSQDSDRLACLEGLEQSPSPLLRKRLLASKPKSSITQIKTAKISFQSQDTDKISIITEEDKKIIQSHLQTLDGVVTATVDIKKTPTTLTIHYRSESITLRSLVDEVHRLGFNEAHYMPENEKTEINDILQAEVSKYQNRFISSLSLQVPIWILIWIIKYTNPHFLVSPLIYGVVPLYLAIIMLFSSVIQFVLGAPFYQGAYKSVRHGQANMDVLVVLGTTAAWLYGLLLLFIGNPFLQKDLYIGLTGEMDPRIHTIHAQAHNFEISSTLITVILLGKFLESFSKKQTVDKLSQLASLKVTKAFLIEPPASLQKQGVETDVELLAIGDLIKVQNGASVPIDGTVVTGTGLCDESMLTGESKPQPKEVDSKVYGGTLLTRGGIIVRVDKLAENAAINQIMKLVESAQSAKAPIQGVADKIAKYFVPIIVLLAVITWIFWFSYTYSPRGQQAIALPKGISYFQFAFNFGISTLVIACPCALGLATPTAVMVGTGLAASFGILIKGGDVLEQINKITTVVFDKTGTLTSGSPNVKDFIDVHEMFKVELPLDQSNIGFIDLLQLTYLCESESEHPLAKAILAKVKQERRQTESTYVLTDFKNINGEGVTVMIAEHKKTTHQQLLNPDQPDNVMLGELISQFRVHCGNDKLMDRYNVRMDVNQFRMNMQALEMQGKTVVCLAIDKTPRLLISLEESHLAKDEAKPVLDYMRNQMGLQVAMITGDNKHTALRVAKYLDIPIENVTYRAYPNDKKKAVTQRQKNGEKVMFVGDGVNDSPVLAQADVGVAINSSADITVQAAGIVIMKDRLDDVLNAMLISKATFRRIKYNFAWAFCYNVILVPIAMGALYGVKTEKDGVKMGLQLDPMWAGLAMALSSCSVVLSSLWLKRFQYVHVALPQQQQMSVI